MSGGLALASLLWSGKVPWLGQLVDSLDVSMQDSVSLMVSPAPEMEELVFLGIDEMSKDQSSLDPAVVAQSPPLQKMQQRIPWNRAVWAHVIERLVKAGASQVILDMDFAQPSDDPEADAALEEMIARYRDKVVLISIWQTRFDPYGARSTQMAEPLEEFLGPLEDETRFGYSNFYQADDGIVREAIYRMSMSEAQRNTELERHPDEHIYESLAAVVAREMGGLPPEGPMRLRFAVHGRDGRREAAAVYAPRSLHEIFVPEMWQDNYDGGKFFEDKVVMIGAASPETQDVHSTPAGTIYGAQLHLQAISCLVHGAFLEPAPNWWSWAALFGMAMVGACLVLFVKNPYLVFVYLTVVAVVWVFGLVYWVDATSMLFSGISGLLGLTSVVLSGQSFEFLLERLERSRLYGQLSRTVSHDVAAAMVKSPDGYIDTARGGRRQIVVLFSDIRGFTARSERENPETLVTQLNEYLTSMVDIIFKHGGTLDKFIGDAIMATWGGLEDSRSEVMAEAAVAAAGEMRTELGRLNAKWEEEGREGFKAGIGIHIGDAVVGEVGSKSRSDFTAIGDAVNLASRIEGITKMLQVPILISGEMASLQHDRTKLCKLGRFRVDGRNEPVEIVAAHIQAGDSFKAALKKLNQGELVEAEDVLLELSPEDELAGAAKFYLKKMEIWKEVPRSEWDGVITLDSK